MLSANPRPQSRFDQGASTVLVALSSNVILAVVKIVAGIWGNSYALTADGIESTMDIFSSAVVLGGITISAIPADENHPYGHGRAESLAAMIVSLVILMAGIGVAVKSVLDVRHPHHEPALFTLIVLVVVIIFKETLFRFLLRAGQSVNSLSLKTEAWHQRSDALTSIAAFVGISFAVFGGRSYESADDWAALAASGVIIFNGIQMLRGAVKEIMDHAPDPECEQAIRSIAQKVDGVSTIEKCKVRKSGIDLFVDIHVQVNGDMPVHKAHLIGHEVKDALMGSTLGIADVLVHIEPAQEII